MDGARPEHGPKESVVRAIQVVPRSFRAVLQWWTLENVSRAADLAVKSMGALAALAALGFFALKPRVTVDGPLPIGSIDLEVLASHYAPDPVPAAVLGAAKRYNANPFPLFGSGDLLSADSQNPLLLFGEEHPLPLQEERTTQERVESALKMLDEVYGSRIYAPPYAVDLAVSGRLTGRDLEFALRAMEAARVDSLFVRVQNEGNGPAEDVRLIVPPGFRRPPPFDIAAGETRRIPVAAKAHRVDVRDVTEAFSVDYDPTSFPDQSALLRWLWVVLGIVVLTLISDVRRVGREQNQERDGPA